MSFSRKMLFTLTLVLAVGFVLPKQAVAGQITIPSADRLPRGDWSYDAMAKLASDGLVSGCSARVFEGDRLLGRLEMAELLGKTVSESQAKDLSMAQEMLMGRLVTEFRPELLVEAPEVLKEWGLRSEALEKQNAVLVGMLSGIASANPVDNEHSNASITGIASLSGSTFAAATLALRRQQYYLQDTSVSQPNKAFIAGYSRLADWSIGKSPLNWGPSYLGSLLVSDNSTPFTQLQGSTQIDFGKILGKFKITEFVTGYTELGQTVYLLGRRYEKPILGGRWHAGFGEILETNETPNPLMLISPFYLYEILSSSSFDEHCNVICSADLLYQAQNGNQYYGEYAIDDISAPKVLFPDRFRRPRKCGATLGFYIPKFLLKDRTSTFRAEYTFVDPLTYEATRSSAPELDYRQDGDLIGSPIGPNSEAIYLRSEQYLSNDFSLTTEYLDQHPRNRESVPSEERRYISLTAAYDLSHSASVAFRIAPYQVTPIGGSAQKGVLYQIRTAFNF